MTTPTPTITISCVLYDGFTVLDIVGPFQVLSALPGAQIEWVADRVGPITDHTGFTTLNATQTFDDASVPDIVVVPGGIGTEKLIPDHPSIAWLQKVHANTVWTTSVCTGSLLLAAAGLLQGKRATCHWLVLEALGSMGVEPTGERVVFNEQDRIVTSAGVSSGIDMGLAIVEKMAGREAAEQIQLAIEYDPQPIVDAGSPEKATPEVARAVQEMFAALSA